MGGGSSKPKDPQGDKEAKDEDQNFDKVIEPEPENEKTAGKSQSKKNAKEEEQEEGKAGEAGGGGEGEGKGEGKTSVKSKGKKKEEKVKDLSVKQKKSNKKGKSQGQEDDSTDAYAAHILKQTEDLDKDADHETTLKNIDKVLNDTDDLSSREPAYWSCPDCSRYNQRMLQQCGQCRHPKPDPRAPKKAKNNVHNNQRRRVDAVEASWNHMGGGDRDYNSSISPRPRGNNQSYRDPSLDPDPEPEPAKIPLHPYMTMFDNEKFRKANNGGNNSGGSGGSSGNSNFKSKDRTKTPEFAIPRRPVESGGSMQGGIGLPGEDEPQLDFDLNHHDEHLMEAILGGDDDEAVLKLG